ncbi:hypothetical protein [Enterococcus sp. AZ196]|uniref:hypothetical protein n=1 Tax=Enterococcus sp. AZ196 TaxID=2774659 RepID=UPI003D269092
MKILLLTKNVLTEKRTQRILQLLGHEVFVTNNYLETFIEREPDKEAMNYFNLCIISETVSDPEVDKLFSRINNVPYKFFRETENADMKDEKTRNPTYDFIKTNASTVELREAIASVVYG